MANRRKRRKFSPEFKAKAVGICRSGNRSITEVAQDLDLTESALRNWLKQADVDAGKGPPDALTTAEKQELTQLRREVRQLRQDREILKAAATFFAKEKQ
jgi:transposase